jgi:myo-inositol-1(or 4)-monophosphatase
MPGRMKSPAEYMFHAATASLLAGKPVMAEFERPPAKGSAASKENTYSVQNPADRQSAATIRKYLSKTCPETGILDEENGHTGDKNLRWIVDPIDGSANFGLRHSDFGISIALAKGDELIASAIYLPAKNKLYFASKAGGAFLISHRTSKSDEKWRPLHERTDLGDLKGLLGNAGKLSVAPLEENRGKMIISTGFSHDSGLRRKAVRNIFAKYLTQFRDIVQPSSAVIGLTDVAEGTRHAYIHEGLKPWDVAAGALLVKEAGGKIYNWDGTAWKLQSRDVWWPILATNGVFPVDKRH